MNGTDKICGDDVKHDKGDIFFADRLIEFCISNQKSSRWGWELGTGDERPQLRRRPPDPAAICTQATAEIPWVPQQAVGGVPCGVMPYLLRGIELWRIGRALFQLQPGWAWHTASMAGPR